MKKILSLLGIATIAVAPAVSTISCGNDAKETFNSNRQNWARINGDGDFLGNEIEHSHGNALFIDTNKITNFVFVVSEYNEGKHYFIDLLIGNEETIELELLKNQKQEQVIDDIFKGKQDIKVEHFKAELKYKYYKQYSKYE